MPRRPGGAPPPPPPSFPGTLVRERMCARRDTRHARMCLRTHAFSAHVTAPGLTWPDPLRLRVPGSSVRPRPRPPVCRPQIGPAAFHPRPWRRSRACAAPLPVARAQRVVRLLRLRGIRTFHSLARCRLERRL